MAIIKYLDKDGLSSFWTKVKKYIDESDFKLNYVPSDKNYQVQADENNNLYVNVPWENTTYDVVGVNGTTGLIKNGSDVTDISEYTACPIVDGVPYYMSGSSSISWDQIINKPNLVQYEETDIVIDSIEESLVTNALRKTAQILSDDEKKQARINIGAGNISYDIIQEIN